MKKEKFTAILSGTIALMLFYAASTKLFNYQQAQASMQKQIFSRSIADLLTWLIPSIEFIISMLLIYTRTRIVGLWASISLLAVFTGYLLLAMSRIFGYRPCSCGGIIQQLSYGEHLVFNLVFLFLSLIALYLIKTPNAGAENSKSTSNEKTAGIRIPPARDRNNNNEGDQGPGII